MKKLGIFLLTYLTLMSMSMGQGFRTTSRNSDALSAYSAGNEALKSKEFNKAEADFSQSNSY